MQQWFDTRGAAERLGLHADSLRRLRRTGGGPRYVRFGKRAVRYCLEELDAWMAARTVSSTAEELVRAMARE
jgi:predicted DNA-binding transcriptional regulator AlpA